MMQVSVRSSLWSLLGLLGLVAPAVAQNPSLSEIAGPPALRATAYDAGVVHTFRTLPVQDGGRIKPFESLAQVALLRLNEKRSARVPDEPRYGEIAGEKLSATEWAMDVLLFPEQAAEYPVIVVTDSEALRVIGLSEVAKRKRDRYSWNDIVPGISRLQKFYEDYWRIEAGKRSRLQAQIVDLFTDLIAYQELQTAFGAARAELEVGDSQLLRDAFGDVASVRFSQAIAKTDRLVTALRALNADRSAAQGDEYRALNGFLDSLRRVADRSSSVVWLPPADPSAEEWLGLAGLFDQIGTDRAKVFESQIEAVALLEAVVDSAADPAALDAATGAWVAQVRRIAEGRGEGTKIDLEVSYHEGDYFYNALVLFVIGFVLCALGWLWPRVKPMHWAAWALTVGGTGYVTWGLVVRCDLLSRPPVSTLYETIVFITGIAVLVAIIIEWINRRRIGLSLGAFVGALGMFVAARYELMDQEDTLVELQAVLRTNFWLAVHVTTVTIGYAGGLLAGFIAHAYLLGKLFGWNKGSYSFYRNIGRMTYGVLCFAVLFATIGTITGGIWANDSWGRFWGWDPKENGALMIVLWQLLILHGRLGGFWRDWGIAMMAVLGNVVVAFSWFGVNLMGVGLHSYGFQPQTKFWLTVFYGTQGLVLLLGVIAWFLEKQAASQGPKPAEA